MYRAVNNFFIGMFAALSAAWLPALVALITTHGSNIDWGVFSGVYVVASLVFAVIIGGLTMIFESGSSRKPREKFFAAIGLPAMIVSTTYSGGTAIAIAEHKQNDYELATTAREEADIKPAETETISSVANGGSSAYSAAELNDEDAGFGIVEASDPPYALALAEANTLADAKQMAAKLYARFPAAEPEVVRTKDKRFLVVQGASAQSRSDAILAAIELKNAGLKDPQLLRLE